MKKRLLASLSALALLILLPGGASAYARDEEGAGPACAVTLDDYHFFIDENGEVMLTDLGEPGTLTALMDSGKLIREQWIVPAYLSARYEHDGNGDVVVLTVEDIWTPSMTLELRYAVTALDWKGGPMCQLPVDLSTVTHNAEVCVALVPMGVRGAEKELVCAPWGVDELFGTFYSPQDRESFNVGRWEWPTDMPWSGDLELLPYNGKTFLLHDRENQVVYASEDGRTWTSLAGTFMAPQEMEETREVWGKYALTWTGEEYLACRRVVQGCYGMMGYAGGLWYDPYCTQVAVLDEDFALKHTYDFGRQVEKVGCYGGVYYAQVADGEGVSVREYNPYGPSTLYRSTDGGRTWQPTQILQILQALQALK